MKIAQKKHTIFLVFLFSQLIILQTVQAETIFINNFWNTLGYGENSVMTDWSEAGRVDFSVLGFTNALYLKNDDSHLYLGIVILGEINESLIWRVNFDADADTIWAEDCKELALTVIGESIIFQYYDLYYGQNDPNPYNDSSIDYSAAKRVFSQVGKSYLIMELKIPLLTSDFLSDFQVSDPESTIIGLSIDVFNTVTTENDTWKGGTYPNYADSSSYAQILFAGPQDRKIPIYEHELPPTTPITTQPLETTEFDIREAGAASGFEGWVGLLAVGATFFIIRKKQWRSKN